MRKKCGCMERVNGGLKHDEDDARLINAASKIIQTNTSSVILRKHPRFSTIQKVGS